MQLTPAQIRAARAFLGWKAEQLSHASEVSIATIRRFEGGRPIGKPMEAAIKRAFMRAGVAFSNGGITPFLPVDTPALEAL
jgi:transcriptional regulator with XRE-family HTH domain